MVTGKVQSGVVWSGVVLVQLDFGTLTVPFVKPLLSSRM